ncbi:MAG: glycosyltransferase family 4 protein [Candidatus Peribacteraceae bacterium]|nr:glycosyltransferase family 4 protein [Candidatus Peribacteraceae bacterium]
MRILFTRFPLESAYGGAEVQTLSLMRGLQERGHDVSFLGSCPVLLKESVKYEIPSTPLEIGIPPVTKWGAVSFLWRQRTIKRQFAQALQATSYKLQAVVMLSMSEKLLLTPIALKQGIAVYWLEHDRIGRWLTWNPWLPRMRRLSREAITVCVSTLSKDLYVQLGWPAENTVDIPNGIDMQRFTKCERIPRESGVLRVGCVARLTQDKGVDLLVRAIAQLPETQLTIIGTGRDEDCVRALISELHLEDRVNLQPSHPDLGSFYCTMDVLALPSRQHDPFGLVAAEAMALGTPVIVTDACGIAGYLGTESFIVPANSQEALAEAMRKLCDPMLRTHLSEAAKRTAHEKFSLPKMLDAYEKLLMNDR